jgi:hypothetical protein
MGGLRRGCGKAFGVQKWSAGKLRGTGAGIPKSKTLNPKNPKHPKNPKNPKNPENPKNPKNPENP